MDAASPKSCWQIAYGLSEARNCRNSFSASARAASLRPLGGACRCGLKGGRRGGQGIRGREGGGRLWYSGSA